jgi:hypothetical protein
VRARASLISVATRALVAPREFAVDRAAATPDAGGGVQALATASDELVEGLLGWVAEWVRAAKPK